MIDKRTKPACHHQLACRHLGSSLSLLSLDTILTILASLTSHVKLQRGPSSCRVQERQQRLQRHYRANKTRLDLERWTLSAALLVLIESQQN
ncbi:hypothetical protein NDA14_003755 [Ustilago hordei]|nr:hypothetical protein NDA14_004482 [Ustilago hordei]KAJ1603850.1 hypothetical protein NDA14_003755 [Ustilago hordei]